MDKAFLQVCSAHKRYGGVHALKGVSLSIRAGELYHLLGENGCGKSTLIKIIAGAEAPTEGQILLNGHEVTALDPIHALSAGIETVYQDLSLLPNLTVAENIALPQQLVKAKGRLLRPIMPTKLDATAARALEVVGLPSGRAFLRRQIDTLPLSTRQLVAISRTVAIDAKLVIMDEPTTSLTRNEVNHLIRVIRRLQENGAAVLFVTHKLDEAREIGGTGFVMRDGELIRECDLSASTNVDLAYWMTGRELEQGRFREAMPQSDVPLLEVMGLSHYQHYNGINLTVGHGEILGITGLSDSGRNEIGLALAGMMEPQAGCIKLGGVRLDVSRPFRVIEAGVAYVPEERLDEGLFLDKPIFINIAMSVTSRLKGALGLVSIARMRSLADRLVRSLEIMISHLDAPVSSLSGGNQQRVLIGRWLATSPRLLVLHGPTMGVDVGSKDTIYRIIHAEAQAGTGIIMISDDLPELIQNCDRILVMSRGRLRRDIKADTVDEKTLYDAVVGSDERLLNDE